MARLTVARLAVLVVGLVALAGCEDGEGMSFLQKKDPEGAEATRAPSPAVRLVDRDVEMPDVFQVSEEGLWDGRPSLGGVWVAYPDVTDPERVMIRNEANGKSVVGALFRRERENPGPKLQVSSDAAVALGILAGAPVRLNVTALRRQEVPIAEETAPPGEPIAEETGQAAELPEATGEAELAAPEEIETAALDPIATAAAAIGAAEAVAEGDAEPPAPAQPEVAAAAEASGAPDAPSKPGLFGRNKRPDKAFIQIGLFSVEANAVSAGDRLRRNGVVPTVEQTESRGKTYWRVIVGPALTNGERTALMRKVKGLGFDDAYLVSS